MDKKEAVAVINDVYRLKFEEDFLLNHKSKLVNILRREGDGYFHMEANRAWEYYIKGVREGLSIG